MTHFDWLHGKRPRKSTHRRHRRRGSAGRNRDRQPLGFDLLEHRTLLTISAVPGNANSVGFLGVAADTLYLKTDSSGVLEWSSDGTNFTTDIDSAGAAATLNPSLPTTITVSVGTVDVEGIATGGQNLTIQALGAPGGQGGNLMATQLNINGNLETQGGSLSILNMEGVDLATDVTVSTRNITGTDEVNSASTGNSGNITITAENPDALNPLLNVNFNSPNVTIGTGAQILAQAVNSGGSTWAPGSVTIEASNTNYSPDTLFFTDLAAVARQASITVGADAIIEGSDVTLEGTAGDVALANAIGQAAGPTVGTVVAVALQDLAKNIPTLNLPISVIYKQGTADVTVGQGAAITASGNVVVDSNAAADATGRAVYTFNGTFGASLVFTDATSDAETTIDQGAQITAGGNVSITTTGSSTSSGTAKSAQADDGFNPSNQTDLLGDFYKPPSAGQIEASGAIGLSNITSLATVDQGATISAGGNIEVAANGVSTNEQSVRSAVYASGAAGLSFGFTQTTTNIQSAVDGTLNATGAAARSPPINPFTQIDYGQTNSKINFGAPDGLTTGEPLVYNPGNGNPIGGLTPGATYYVIVVNPDTIQLATSAANATAEIPITFNAYPVLTTAGGNPTYLPITQVDTTTDTIPLGFGAGLTAGEALTYHAVAGLAIGNLVDGQTYYVILVAGDPTSIQFASSPGGAAITLNLNTEFDGLEQNLPATLNSSTNMLSLGFTTGFQVGDSFIYEGSGINGLTDGATYWVIPNANDSTGESFQLADSLANAQTSIALPITAATSNVTLAFDPTVTPLGDNAFDVGFNIGLTPAYASGPTVTPPSFPALDYHGMLGTTLAGLIDGQTYYAMPDPANPRVIRLAASAADARVGYEDAQESYNNFYNATEQQAYNSFLSSNPGDTGGAQAAGIQVANLAAAQQGANWTEFGFRRRLARNPAPAGPYTITVANNEIVVPFATGFQLGDSLLYVGPIAGQTAINGLVPGTNYYVIPDPNNPDAFGLADTAYDALLDNMEPISLPAGVTSTTINLAPPTLAPQTVTVDSTTGTLDFGFNPMLATGER